jgi:DNA-directed RNA polymerase subunit RPC12/RpoP
MDTKTTVVVCDNCQSQFSINTIKPDGKWECTYCGCNMYIMVETERKDSNG